MCVCVVGSYIAGTEELIIGLPVREREREERFKDPLMPRQTDRAEIVFARVCVRGPGAADCGARACTRSGLSRDAGLGIRTKRGGGIVF